jgi:uncharacterized protein YifE (UPF0438 family)
VSKQPLFTDSERALLQKWIKLYIALDTGEHIPTTSEQHHFVRVCRGQVEPSTEHEQVYLKVKNFIKADLQRKAKVRHRRENSAAAQPAVSGSATNNSSSAKVRTVKKATPQEAHASCVKFCL